MELPEPGPICRRRQLEPEEHGLPQSAVENRPPFGFPITNSYDRTAGSWRWG